MYAYDPSYRHFVAVDCIIFGFDHAQLKLLLGKRRFETEKGAWSLMGGLVKIDESLDEAAGRVLEELTGLKDVYMEQCHTYGAVDRDSVERTVSTAYYALIRVDDYQEQLGKKYDAHWFPLNEFPTLVFDHNVMVKDALAMLKRKTRNQPIGFELLPEKFTIPQLRALYEAINQIFLDPGNFSNKVKAMNLLIRLDEKDKSSSKKGAFYYRFDKERYHELAENGFNFSL